MDTAKTEKSVALLDKVYGYALEGIPKFDEPIEDIVRSYLNKTSNREEAIDRFIRNQKLKCSTTGFITGLGGLFVLPVAIPADLASSLYIELRMIAAIAMFRGYNIHDDQVKTAVYLCLTGNTVGDVVKQVGIKTIQNVTIKKLLPKLTREVIKSINKKVGFKLVTKAGNKGLINFSKCIPILGGLIGGAWNWGEVALYSKYAKKMFTQKD